MKLKDIFLKEKERDSKLYKEMCKYSFIAQDDDGEIKGFYIAPKMSAFGVWQGQGDDANSSHSLCNIERVFDYFIPLRIDWSVMGIFPPVGTKVRVWYESDFLNSDLDKQYLSGVVVYSGEKGVTVDVGFLYSTSERGNLVEYNPNDEIVEFIYKELPQNYFQNDSMRKSLAEHLSTLYTEGKFPKVTKDDE